MSVAATEAYTAANLKTEIQTGPYAATFSPMITASNWPGIAAVLNDKTASAAGQVNHVDMQASDVAAQVNYGEFATLTANQVSTWQSIIQAQVVKIGSVNIQSFINSAFSATNAPNTRSALQALYTQLGSRAEVLFGTGKSVSNIDVQYAMTGSGAGNSWGL